MNLKNKISIMLSLICLIPIFNIDFSYSHIKENFNFKNITIEDGLSQSTVETIFQDSRGYIWFGTNDGLDRYNGYDIKSYKYDKYSDNSLANNYIVDILEDKDGYLWVSTIAGLSMINQSNNEIKNYYSDKDKGNLSNENLWQLLYTKDGRLLASTVDGLNLYNKEKDSFIRVLSGKNDLPSQFIYSLAEDNKGHIWIGTDKGLIEVDKNFKIVKTYEDSIKDSHVYNIYYDENNYMWISTLDNGLFRIDLNTKYIKNYKANNLTTSIPSNTVRATILDDDGCLWVGTDKGISKYNYETEKFSSYKREAYQSNALVNNNIFSFMKDSSGLLWIGTLNGISSFNPNGQFIHYKSEIGDESISSNMVHGIYEDGDNTLWVGSDENGVNIINNNNFSYLTTENSNLISNKIEDITGYENKIYIGTNEGLSVLIKLNKNANKYIIINYTTENGLPSNKIRSLYVDKRGFLWIGLRDGLAILNKDSNIIDVSFLLDNAGVKDAFVRAIYEDSNGYYYIGCFLDGGLIQLDPKTKKYKVFKSIEGNENSISNNSIRYINEDLDGNILVGTSHGLNILNTKTDKFTHYTEKDGLANNTIYGILVDKDNNYWMSTNGGLSKLNNHSKKIQNFTVADGLQSNEFNGRSCFMNFKGDMYFGGINGFNIFNIESISESNFKPNVILDSFEVSGLNKDNIDNAKFKSIENNIRISFFANDYKNIHSTKYYYKLNGITNDWNTTKDNTLLFANLSPGTYTLKIKAETQNGLVSNEETVSFNIKQPIWKSTFAIYCYISIAIFLVYYQRNRIKMLDKLVNKRTEELQNEMKKNKKLFDRIINLEKNKNMYFVNLSHELRTPLNVINSVNQLVQSFCVKNQSINPDKLSSYMNTIQRNSNRLLDLIKNLIDYTKIENNSFVLKRGYHDIVHLVEETVLDMKEYIEENGLELIFDTDIEEKIIQCDKLEIERCVINLVGNAVKFTSAGLITVYVKDLGDKVSISVKDTGVGISKENQKLIFDRFSQVIDENEEQKSGSGLGLTITSQLVALHNGTISVESEVGVGSEFIITLPTNADNLSFL